MEHCVRIVVKILAVVKQNPENGAPYYVTHTICENRMHKETHTEYRQY